MAQKVLISRSTMKNIADAIRTKSGTSVKYTPANMATAINAIPGGSFNWMGEGVECLNANLYNFNNKEFIEIFLFFCFLMIFIKSSNFSLFFIISSIIVVMNK